MTATLDQQLNQLCLLHDLKAICINSYLRDDGTSHVAVTVHRGLHFRADKLYGDSITAAFKDAMERLNEVRAPDFAPIEVAA